MAISELSKGSLVKCKPACTWAKTKLKCRTRQSRSKKPGFMTTSKSGKEKNAEDAIGDKETWLY